MPTPHGAARRRQQETALGSPPSWAPPDRPAPPTPRLSSPLQPLPSQPSVRRHEHARPPKPAFRMHAGLQPVWSQPHDTAAGEGHAQEPPEEEEEEEATAVVDVAEADGEVEVEVEVEVVGLLEELVAAVEAEATSTSDAHASGNADALPPQLGHGGRRCHERWGGRGARTRDGGPPIRLLRRRRQDVKVCGGSRRALRGGRRLSGPFVAEAVAAAGGTPAAESDAASVHLLLKHGAPWRGKYARALRLTRHGLETLATNQTITNAWRWDQVLGARRVRGRPREIDVHVVPWPSSRARRPVEAAADDAAAEAATAAPAAGTAEAPTAGGGVLAPLMAHGGASRRVTRGGRPLVDVGRGDALRGGGRGHLPEGAHASAPRRGAGAPPRRRRLDVND